MDIRLIFGVRGSYGRSGGSSSLPPEHSLAWRENQLQWTRAQQSIDRETVYIEGPPQPVTFTPVYQTPPCEYTLQELRDLAERMLNNNYF